MAVITDNFIILTVWPSGLTVLCMWRIPITIVFRNLIRMVILSLNGVVVVTRIVIGMVYLISRVRDSLIILRV